VRTPYRIATTAVALAAVFPFGTSAAGAATADVTVSQATWYWAEQPDNGIEGHGIPVPAAASGIPEGDLGVAYTNGADSAPDKEAYVAWDISAIPFEATIRKFAFTVTLDPNAPQLKSENVPLVACLPVRLWAAAATAGAEEWSDKPEDDCSGYVAGDLDTVKGTYTFDVADFAQTWSNGDPMTGVAIRQKPGYTTPFQLALTKKITTEVSYDPKAPEVVVPSVAPVPTVQQPTVTVPDQTSTSGGLGGVTVQPAPEPQAPPVAPPVVPIVRQPQPVTQVAATPFRRDGSIPSSLWLAALAAVALIGAVSLVLGDAEVAVVAPRDDRLLRRTGRVPADRTAPGKMRARLV
jgi:hypothetical protein